MQYGHVAKVLRTTLCPHHLTLSCEDSSAGQRNTYCIFCKAWFQTFRSNVQVCTAISQNTSSMHSNASKKQMDLVGILRSLHYDPSTLLEYTNLARMAPTIHSIFTSFHFTRQQLHCYTLLQLSNNTPSGFLPPMPMQHRTLAAREKQHPAPVVHPVTLLWRVLTLWVAASRRRTSKLWNYDRHNGTSPQT